MVEEKLAVFSGKKIRRLWDEEKEKWYFSVIDIVEVLTGASVPRRYWSDLKHKLVDEGSELYEKIVQLKMRASDGKYYMTDTVDTETAFRIIQSIPSPKAEPFKIWLARVGNDRVEETHDPELAINRALKTYLRKGYSREWINQRLKSIEIRKELTDEWENRGVKEGQEFAILTDDITMAWSDMTTKSYKKYKGLKKESLRDNMTNVELVLNMLGETATTEISKKKKPESFPQNRQVAKEGGSIAGGARGQLEKHLGRKVVSKKNFIPRSRIKINIPTSELISDGRRI